MCIADISRETSLSRASVSLLNQEAAEKVDLEVVEKVDLEVVEKICQLFACLVGAPFNLIQQ